LPDVRIDTQGMAAYAREHGIRVADMTDLEKEMFIGGDI
jgi:hypothetical protein